MLNGFRVYECGTKEWYQNGNLHREDGPAIEYVDGGKFWYYKGIFAGAGDKPNTKLWTRLTSHELNGGPLLNGCIVELNGAKRWYVNDQLHREDGPAVERVDMYKLWYFNGEFLGDIEGFWRLWDRLTEEQRGSPTLLKYMPH